MIYFHVKLLNDSLDKSTADVVPRETPYGYTYLVYSDNVKMKNHLEKLLQYPAFIAAPGRNDANFFADSAMEIPPTSIYYVNSLPEILSWRGYDAVLRTEVHKSFEFMDFTLLDSIKAVGQDVYTNARGERIVKYVPKGYVAVHSDGKTVAGGRYLNANVDKEGSKWTLIQNPHEESTPQQRQDVRDYVDAGLQEYHPGLEEGIYAQPEGTEVESDYTLPKPYVPKEGEGVTLVEHYKIARDVTATGVPSHFPAQLEPGHVVYSPQTGQAFDSKFWPPEGIDYENYDWYIFQGTGLADDEKELYSSLTGLTPAMIPGVTMGMVLSDKDLDVSEGYKLGRTPVDEEVGITDLDNANTMGVVPNPVPEVKLEISEMLQPWWKRAYEKAKETLSAITSLTQERIDPSLDKMKIPELRGTSANFMMNLYGYQKAIVTAMTSPAQYEVFGGPKGWHGYFLNVKMGLGKTAMVTAANAIMRNRGKIQNGTQTTIVTAPNKNVYVWQTEVGKFLGENAVVIDGDKKTRIAQWEKIIDQANSGELPTFIIVGSSKFRYVKGDRDDDAQDAWELDTDAKYMKLLALGGKSGSKKVKGNHIGAFTVDESGQYVNPDAARHSALKSIVDAVYHGKGIVWTLNGNISGNSATDTISELSFINKYVRDNYLAFSNEYTKTNANLDSRQQKGAGRKVWKDHKRVKDFFFTFGSQIYTLDGQTVAGENFGLMRTDDELTPMGSEWGSVYLSAERKLMAANENNMGTRAMGLLSLLINSGFGSVSPARMLEYDINSESIVKPIMSRLTTGQQMEFMHQYQQFLDETTEVFSGVGRLPKRKMSVGQRDEAYNRAFSEGYRALIQSVVDEWECPYTNTIVAGIKDDLQQMTPAGRPLKIGVAGFSKASINKIAKSLREAYPASKYLIQIVDGDVPPKQVDEIQAAHQNEKVKTVITLVTGAGAYGLSLPADRTYRAPMWNSATGLQFDGRFHRKAEQKNTTTVVIPQGITQYMRELELRKGSMAESATNILLEVDDEGDELNINTNSISRLLDKLRQYRPTIISEG